MRLFVREVQCYVTVVDGFKNEAKNNREKVENVLLWNR